MIKNQYQWDKNENFKLKFYQINNLNRENKCSHLYIKAIMKASLWIALLLLLSACAFYPRTQYNEDVKRCDLAFKKLTMDITSSSIRCQGSSKSAGACVVLAGVISGGSAIVSGSIVLVGNSLHWLEKQGKCDDSFLNSKILHHNKPLLKDEGVLVTQEKSAQ